MIGRQETGFFFEPFASLRVNIFANQTRPSYNPAMNRLESETFSIDHKLNKAMQDAWGQFRSGCIRVSSDGLYEFQAWNSDKEFNLRNIIPGRDTLEIWRKARAKLLKYFERATSDGILVVGKSAQEFYVREFDLRDGEVWHGKKIFFLTALEREIYYLHSLTYFDGDKSLDIQSVRSSLKQKFGSVPDHLLIPDDVVTSGGKAYYLWKTLTAVGVRKVSQLAVASLHENDLVRPVGSLDFKFVNYMTNLRNAVSFLSRPEEFQKYPSEERGILSAKQLVSQALAEFQKLR